MNDLSLNQPTAENPNLRHHPVQDHFNVVAEPPKILPAIFAGAIACFISAMVWAAISVATGYQIGWIAIGVGFLVGVSVKRFGGNPDPVLGLIGGVFAFLGCFIGNILTIFAVVAEAEGIPLTLILSNVNYAVIPEVMLETTGILDLLFYGLAIFQGFKLPSS